MSDFIKNVIKVKDLNFSYGYFDWLLALILFVGWISCLMRKFQKRL